MGSFVKRHGNIVLSIAAWVVVGAFFAVFSVRDASSWTRVIVLLMLLVVVCLIGLVRYLGMDPSSVRNKWSMLALCILFPPAEKYLAEVERRGSVISQNDSVVANMVHTLNAYDFCSLAGPLETKCAAWTISKTFEPPDELGVESCAARVAELDTVVSVFDGHSPLTISRVWSLLYWDRYEPDHDELLDQWDLAPNDLASPVALAVLRRKEIERLALPRDVLEEFLSTQRPFQLDGVRGFAADEAAQRSASQALIANMRHTLDAYDLGGLSIALEAKLLSSRHASQALTVEECADGVLDDVVDEVVGVRSIFPHAGPPDLEQMLSVLYWDRYEPTNAGFLHVWQSNRPVLAPLVARSVHRRLGATRSGVGERELTDVIQDQNKFSLDAVLHYVRTRPTHVAERMRDILVSYAPRPGSAALAQWPTIPPGMIAILAKQPVGTRVKTAASCCASTVSGVHAASAKLLEFLYRRRFDRPTAITYWDTHARGLIPELAGVLARGTRVPVSTKAFSHDAQRVERMLTPLHEYSLTLVKRELFELQDLLNQCEDFATFLSDTGDIAHGLTPDASDIIDCVDQVSGGFPADEHEFTRLTLASLSNEVLIRFAGKAIANFVDGALGPEIVNHLALVAVGEFVDQEPTCPPGSVDAAARRAAQTPFPARLLLGLMTMRRDQRGGTLRDVVDQVRSLLVERDEDAAVLRAIRWAMLHGDWLNSIPDMSAGSGSSAPTAVDPGADAIEQAVVFVSALRPDLDLIERGIVQLHEQVEAVERFEHGQLEPELQQLHNDIPQLRKRVTGIEEFERDELGPKLLSVEQELGLLPTRTEAARLRDLALALARPSDLSRYYLITFDSRSGPLASLLDTLTKLTSDGERRLRALTEPSDSDSARAVELIDRIKSDYYRFGDYTKYARVGLLPKNEDSEQFTDNLFADLRWLLCVTLGQLDFPRRVRNNIDWNGVELTFINLGLPIKRELVPVNAKQKKMFREPPSIDRVELRNRLGDVDPLR